MPELGMYDTPLDKYIMRLLERYGHVPRPPGQAIVPVDPPGGGGRGIPGYGHQPPQASPPGNVPKLGPGSRWTPGAIVKRGFPVKPSGGSSGIGRTASSAGRLGGYAMLAALVTQGLTEEGAIPANLFEESDVADRVEHHLRELGTGIDDRLYNRGGLPEGEYASGLDEFLHGMTNPMSAHYSESEERAGLVDRPGPQGAAVSASIGEREEKEAAVRKIAAAKEQSRAEAAAQDDWVRSVGYEPDQDLSNPEKGILVGEIPADKLLRIRKQAAERAPGYTGGEGSFSQQEMTPELASREAENARWLGQQTERDLEYAVTPEMARRNPEYAASAADDIKGLRAQRDMERRTANQEKLVEGLSGGGTVPFETAMKMEAAGMDVPWRAVGMSPQAATSGIEEIFVGAEQNLARIANDLELSNSQGAQETVAYLRYILSNRGRIADMLRRGADPIKTLEDLKEIATRQARDSGALAFWDSNVNQQAVEGQ